MFALHYRSRLNDFPTKYLVKIHVNISCEYHASHFSSSSHEKYKREIANSYENHARHCSLYSRCSQCILLNGISLFEDVFGFERPHLPYHLFC